MSTPPVRPSSPTVPRPRGPVDTRVFRLVPTLRGDAAGLGALAALGAAALLGQLVAAAWAVTVVETGTSPWPPLTAFVAATLVRSALRSVEQVLTARAAGRARVALGTALVGSALRLSPDRLAEAGPGRISALATNGVDSLEKYVTRYLPAVVPAVLLPPAVIVILALLDPRSAVVVVVTLPLIPLFAVLVGRLTESRSAQQWQLMSKLSSHFLDVVQGLVTLRAYRRADRQVEVLTAVGERHRAATVRVLRIAFLSGTALDLVATLSVGLVAVEAGLRVAAGDLGLGTALVAILVAPEAYRPVRELGARFHESADATAVLDEVSVLVDDVPAPVATAGGVSLPSGVALVADRLTVRLPGRSEPVLSGVGLWVFAGSIMAVVGPSGVGKTTLIRVLARQLTPESGFVNGADPVYLPQRPSFPLARTVREAVTAAWPQASREVIDEALRDAAALDWINALPAGLDTALAEDGRDLSAGQRQRLALARTYVQAAGHAARVRPVVLLLDEPTAHLDDVTEKAVLAGLRRRADSGTAVVTVAHRPAAIAAADEVTHLWGNTSRVSLPGDPGSSRAVSSVDQAVVWSQVEEIAPSVVHGGGRAGAGSLPGLVPSPRPGAGSSAVVSPSGPSLLRGSDNRLSRVEDEDLEGRSSHADSPPAREPQGDAVLPGFGRAWADARPTRSWIPARLRTASMNLALVLGTLSSLSGVALTAVAAWLLTKASGQPPILTLTVAVVGVRLFAVTRPLLSYLDRLVAHDVALADLGRLRARVYADLVPRVPGPALPRRGDLLTRLVDDVDAVGDTVLRWRRPATVAAATLVVALLVAAIIDRTAALAALPGLLLAGVVAPVVAGAGADRRAERTAEAKAGYSQTVVEVLAGAEDVKALGATATGVEPVRTAGRHATEADRVQVRRNALAEFLRTAGAGLAVAGVMLVTTGITGSTGLTLQQVGVLVLGTLALADVTATLPDAVNARTRGRIARRRLAQVLQTPAASVDAVVDASARELGPVGLDVAPAGSGVTLAGSGIAPAGPGVELSAVVAGWDRSGAPVLTGLDLDLGPGRRIAVQGPSGSGKSTLAGLVLKFLDPREGRLSLAGRDYGTLAGDRVRESIGLVPDDDHVFASTVRENLKLAKPDASDGELRVVLTRARLGNWFNATPDGLDTWLGERGATMSAGERRRMALARALLADRPVLVLDEPAESLDAETAQAVLADILDASSGKTVLLVTHRAEGLDAMDAVLHLENGSLVNGNLVNGNLGESGPKR
ncbi:thiol reductant ABC exporter subunit CydC [Kineosporia sp. NBRC 101731]|uniref:thiol reductant ABC exporter subunit CydC n=1 Tax=Kineosporia sp. NBRC 101731 TaxID=3032199 RepID=UPI0024A28EFF|nr:thiol reductant ABC exporter subunit CydC [Kineosporia sp. NBRC 101731]GLY31755.1 ABC transporter [Kineosporia sp. NBRC 101731]